MVVCMNLETLEAELEAGTYPDAPASLQAAALNLARACDQEPTNASLWRQYLDALRELRETNDVHIDPADEFAEKLRRAAAQVRDAQAAGAT